MNGVRFLKLIGDARAFRQSASSIEGEIARLQVSDGDLSPVGGASGWPSHTVWESLKTASHFNLAIALELRLNCLLRLDGAKPLTGRDRHRLARLHNRLGARGASTGIELERLFGEAMTEHPFELVVFLSTDDPAPSEGPADRRLQSLKDVFVYMDEDVKLETKRYPWEHAANGQWQHYIDDLSVFFAFLDSSENLAMEMARKQGIVR